MAENIPQQGGKNTFYCPNDTKKLIYIIDTPTKIISRFSFKNPLFLKKINSYDFIILHSLTKFNQQLVAHARNTTKFVWIGMGSDYYDLIYENPEMLLQDITKQHFINNRDIEKSRSLIKDVIHKILYKNVTKNEIVKKISFFSPVLENEYKMIAKKNDASFPKYVKWNYAINSQIALNNKNFVLGNNILIGNSATYTNNHLDIFELISNYNFGDKKIVCPLSYGDQKYADFIEQKGKFYFGRKFTPIRHFMSYDQYIKLLSTCSIAIMNHIRQQSGGNISAMLFIGAKVFLNKINPLYSHYKLNNVKLFTICDLSKNFNILEQPLSDDIILKNRKILSKLISFETALKKTQNLIKALEQHSNIK